MAALLASFGMALVALFLVVEPVGAMPVFASLTRGRPEHEVHRAALRASVAGAVILSLFAIGGGAILGAMHVRPEAFRVAGGLVLLLAALDMVRARLAASRCTSTELGDARREDIAIVPVAIPLLAGPGSLATVTMLVSRTSDPLAAFAVILAIPVVFGITYWLLRSSTSIQRVLGPAALSVVQRVLGLILAAASVQLIVDGLLKLLR